MLPACYLISISSSVSFYVWKQSNTYDLSAVIKKLFTHHDEFRTAIGLTPRLEASWSVSMNDRLTSSRHHSYQPSTLLSDVIWESWVSPYPYSSPRRLRSASGLCHARPATTVSSCLIQASTR